MSISATFKRRFLEGSDLIEADEVVTADDLTEFNVSANVVNGAPLTITQSVDVSKIVGIYVSTDVDDVTFDPSAGTTLTLKANCPYLWTTNSNLVNTWAADFTSIVVTNPDALNTANIEIRIISTP